jgi:L-threonylcarbamoyladenylate synthase
MVILEYKKQYHKQIIAAAVTALKKGRVVAYPTDTCYGFAVDASSISAIKKLYQIKGRDFNKPVHIVVPSVAYAKKIAVWNKSTEKLIKKFWPGALTLILPVGKGLDPSLQRTLKVLSANTGTIGLRMPKNHIALDLAKNLKQPITATSANVSGMADCYSADEIIAQFFAKGGSESIALGRSPSGKLKPSGGKNQKYKPDIIINAGRLPENKPSTLVRAFDDVVKILRAGPVSEKQILKSLLNTK